MNSSYSSRRSIGSRVSPRRHRHRVQFGLERLEDRTNPAPTIVAEGAGDFGNAMIWRDVMTQAHRVPGPGDYASSGFPISASGNYTVASITFTGGLTVQGGTFTVSSASTLIDGSGVADPNSGSLIVGLTLASGATLHVTQGISFLAVVNSEISSNIQVDANGSLRFLRGENNLNAGTTLTGPGLFRIEGDVLGGPNVQVNTPVTAPSNMLLRGGVLTGPSTLTIPTGVTFNWNTIGANLAAMKGTGTTVVQPGATLLIGGANHNVLEDRTISNAGTVTFANAVTFTWGGSAKIDNLPGGTFNIQTDAPINAFPSSTATPTIANAGTLIKTSPTGSGVSYIGPLFNNTGAVQVNSGAMNLARGGTEAGAFTLAAGTAIVLLGSVTNLNAGTTFSGPGLLSLTGGELFVNAPVSIPNYSQSGGSVRGAATLTLAGTADWSVGAMIDAGTTVVAAGATLTLSGPFAKGITTSRVLNNAGIITHIGTGEMVVDSGAVLNNQATGVYNLLADTNVVTATGTVNNAGQFVKTSNAGGKSIIAPTFNNTGTLRVDSGILEFATNLTQTAGSTRVAAGAVLLKTGSAMQLNGGTLLGNGTVGNLATTGGGSVSPGTSPGILTANGNVNLAGPYVVEINGRTPGSQYDRLAVNGFVTLGGGALNPSLGYTPAAGDGYVILTNDGADLVSGTFAGLPEGATMTLGGLTFRITYRGGDGNDVALTSLTVPPPAVATTTINNGAAQRSRVTDVTIPFSQVVTFAGAPSAAFRLTRTGPGGPTGDVTLAVDLSGSTASQTIAKLTFSGALTQFGSLMDGNYTLTIFGTQVSVGGVALDGDGDGTPGGDYTFGLFRFYGDVNGDRRVDISDFGFFSVAYLTPANYNAALDFNNDGRIDIADFGQFSVRFFTTLP